MEEVVSAVRKLEVSVVRAFAQHDKDLRAEVEKVNSQIRLLIGTVALIGAVVLITKPLRSCDAS